MAVVQLRVQAGARRSRVVGKVGDEWKIAIQAPAVDGKANAALIKLLGKLLGVPRSAITIKRGVTSRRKLILVDGIENERVDHLLGNE